MALVPAGQRGTKYKVIRNEVEKRLKEDALEALRSSLTSLPASLSLHLKLLPSTPGDHGGGR